MFFLTTKSLGILSFDGLFSFIPLILMVSFSLNLVAFISTPSAENFHRQQVFDKLTSIADYSLKIGLVSEQNYLDLSKPTSEYSKRMVQLSKLSNLSISTSPVSGNMFCIYRLGVFGASKAVDKIYFCGD